LVVYQVYPRSFQDSDGDGVGDLRGIAARLDHLAWLGVDALWLSPIYPSPMADGGYDVADHTAVDPRFGTLADFDALVARAHALGLRVLLDVVPCHTSIEHPWFRDHPERYVFSPVDGPPNNWRATFGGPAWSEDPRGRGWYLHSFYPEQPDLDWRHPAVAAQIGAALRFWRARGVDGFRLDALQQLLKDPELRDDPVAAAPFPFPLDPDYATLEHRHSSDAPDTPAALAALRAGAGADALLVGEVFLPTARVLRYLEHLDGAFCFELFFAGWEAPALAAAIGAAAADGRLAWVLANHDFPRLATRVGAAHVRAAALLLLTLPGTAFVYQGDEIGQHDGPPPDAAAAGRGGAGRDRAGRDACRRPVQWDASPEGGFTTGTPWLAPLDPERRNVAAQREDQGSLLHLYRALLAARRSLRGPVTELRACDGVLSFRRGAHRVAVNTGRQERPAPHAERVVVATHGGAPDDVLKPGAAVLLAV
jgi:alpha-glucosidase